MTKVQIPDAAVQAAAKCYAERVVSINDTFSSLAREMLTAAYPHLPLGYEVKLSDDNIIDLAVSVSNYKERGTNGVEYEVISHQRIIEFARLLLSQIVTKPVDVAAVRRQALEEAAKLIDEGFDKAVGKSWRKDGKPSKNDSCPHDKFMYEDCEKCASAAIRALSDEPAQHEKAWYFKKGDAVPSWLERVVPDVITLTFGANVVVTTINGFYEIRPETINDVGVPLIVGDAQNQPISVTGQGKGVNLISYDQKFKSVNIDPARGEQWQSIRNVLKSYVDAGMQLADNLDDISNEILRLPAAPTSEAGRAALAKGGGDE